MPRKILIRPELLSKLSNVEFAGYKKALSRFMDEQEKNGLNLEKLHGKLDKQSVYSIRMNGKGRLVLCAIDRPEGQVWCLIDVLPNHEYQKLKEKPKGWLSHQIDKSLNNEMEFTDFVEASQDDVVDVDEDINIDVSSGIEFCGSRGFILFDEGQAQAKEKGMKSMPAIITGPPGSGKTSVGLSVVWQNIQHAVENGLEPKPILMIAKSANLIQFIRSEFTTMCAEHDGIRPEWVEFKTPQAIYLERHEGVNIKGEDDFITWFCHELATQNKLKKKDKTAPLVRAEEASLVYQELHTMSGYSSFEEYSRLVTSKLSLFPNPETRKWLWQVYQNYMKKLTSNNEVDLAFLPIELQKAYDFIVVDEAQDLSRRQISSLAQQSERVIFCIGDHQRLFGSETTVPFIRSVYWQKNQKDITTLAKLDASYRCPREVTELANGVLKLKYQAIGGREYLDKNELVYIQSNPVLSQAGNIYWLEQEKELAPLTEDRSNAQFAVITSPQFIDEAAKLFGRERVFTPAQIKGLEYDHILIFKLLEQDEYKAADPVIGEEFDIQNTGIAKNTEGSIRHGTAFNELFVAVTRAQRSLSIYQPSLREIRCICGKLRDKIAAINNSNNNNNNNNQAHVQSRPNQSSEEEWRRRAVLLEQQGLTEQAQAIINEHLNGNRTPHLPVTAAVKRPSVISNVPATVNAAKSKSTNQVSQGKKANKKGTLSNPPLHLLEKVVNKIPGAMKELLQHKDVINYLFHISLNTINADLPVLSLVEYFKKEQDDGKRNELLDALVTRLNDVLRGNTAREQQDAFMALLYYKPASFPVSLSTPLLKQLPPGSTAFNFLCFFKQNRRNELNEGIVKGQLKVVRTLECLGLLDAWDSQGDTPAQVAIRSRQWAILLALAKSGIDVNKPSKNGVSPLAFAVQKNDVEAINKLKALGVELDSSTRAEGLASLFVAAQDGRVHVDAIHALIKGLSAKEIGDLLNQPTMNGATPLYTAAEMGQVAVINTLIALGAKVDIPYKTGATPFFIAAKNGHADAINALIKNLSAKEVAELVNKPTTDGATPLYIAAQNGHIAVINTLIALGAKVDIPHKTGATPLFIAAFKGHADVIDALIKNLSAKEVAELVNKPTMNGATPLYIAAEMGHADVIDALIKNLSAKEVAELVNKPTVNGATPLYIAAQNGHIAVINTLIALGAKVDISYDTGATSLYIAAENGHADAINALIKNLSAKEVAELVNKPTMNGATPLYIAALKGHADVIDALIKNLSAKEVAALVSKPNTDGATPLYAAAGNGHVDAIRALIEELSEAESEKLINQPNAKNATPLFIAAQYGHTNVVSCLLEMGASCSVACQSSSNILIGLAKDSGKEEALIRAKTFIKSKGLTVDSAETLPILPHEIAYILGYSEIEQLVQATMSSPQKLVNSHFGLFKEVKVEKAKVDDENEASQSSKCSVRDKVFTYT
ncbi:ankyrin repeat domain-containing protein [Legionella sp. CNM-1927-20]|uniref:ankyrin repeat domain-containing protein n=1 Tax=Legionella sp. CNM-1927-20 TaxID=3422221 RepID=UPI00403AD7D7